MDGSGHGAAQAWHSPIRLPRSAVGRRPPLLPWCTAPRQRRPTSLAPVAWGHQRSGDKNHPSPEELALGDTAALHPEPRGSVCSCEFAFH